ncbi:hypothetical protein BCR34DRAFT_554847 [Clohesyomyces aquaticus]|uniref:Uncharacterized protein n=1 Tax=Clohesyomyces aquaticus TaxID=1231657 RepID=A0A1Y2A6X1_9PLEO|nr:hypothetical protein BCR34DRAFT_554847 [Clohesyomyces aquaticus]
MYQADRNVLLLIVVVIVAISNDRHGLRGSGCLDLPRLLCPRRSLLCRAVGILVLARILLGRFLIILLGLLFLIFLIVFGLGHPGLLPWRRGLLYLRVVLIIERGLGARLFVLLFLVALVGREGLELFLLLGFLLSLAGRHFWSGSVWDRSGMGKGVRWS